jgi:methylenetetrahydrofolate reductase (NADPH)
MSGNQDLITRKTNHFKETLTGGSNFCVSWEMVVTPGENRKILDSATRIATSGRIQAISLTDNAGGRPASSPLLLAKEIKKLGVEPLVHLACRDRNRNDVESLLLGLSEADIRNILIISGDYPLSGISGLPKPVFDLDPVTTLELISRLKSLYEAFDIFAGVAFSPFKKLEAELMGQYYKLEKKIRAGALFAITQVGYDARKMHEVVQWFKTQSVDIPVMANVYVLTYPVAMAMRENQLPGCVVSEGLVEQLAKERQAPDKGKAARLLRAAKMYAMAKGMGYSGVHIGGPLLDYDSVSFIIEKGEELYPRWEEIVEEFSYPEEGFYYYFLKDDKTGLNASEETPRLAKGKAPFIYRFSRWSYSLFFRPHGLFFSVLKTFAGWASKRAWLGAVTRFFEHRFKGAIYGCEQCGDCALPDVAYICPLSGCPKNERNGPCGGSFDGWCEVYPGQRRCIWVEAYNRLKSHHEEDALGECVVPPQDWSLKGTSSWLNYYLGKDHTGKKLK